MMLVPLFFLAITFNCRCSRKFVGRTISFWIQSWKIEITMLCIKLFFVNYTLLYRTLWLDYKHWQSLLSEFHPVQWILMCPSHTLVVALLTWKWPEQTPWFCRNKRYVYSYMGYWHTQYITWNLICHIRMKDIHPEWHGHHYWNTEVKNKFSW